MEDFTAKQIEVIRRFVSSDEFIFIKDAFISHTPEGGSDGQRTDDSAKNLGKFLGTRYVFNTLEKLARKKPNTPEGEKNRNQSRNAQSGRDPDLD